MTISETHSQLQIHNCPRGYSYFTRTGCPKSTGESLWDGSITVNIRVLFLIIMDICQLQHLFETAVRLVPACWKKIPTRQQRGGGWGRPMQTANWIILVLKYCRVLCQHVWICTHLLLQIAVLKSNLTQEIKLLSTAANAFYWAVVIKFMADFLTTVCISYLGHHWHQPTVRQWICSMW